MKDKNTDSVQNRFTAYLMAAVSNKRIKYMESRNRKKEQEICSMDLLEKNYSDFSTEFSRYIAEQAAENYRNTEVLQDILKLVEGKRMSQILSKLKEQDQALLFGRIFGEQDFNELGEQLGLTPKQAEMAYYYVIRKLRKRLEGNKYDEFEMILMMAQLGDRNAQEKIFRMYRPLLIKNSMDKNVFDEDLYQELSLTMLHCILKFRI